MNWSLMLMLVASGCWISKNSLSENAFAGLGKTSALFVQDDASGWDKNATLALAQGPGQVPAAEAFHWMRLLCAMDDSALPVPACAQKYLNMSMASSILSATSTGVLRQRFWSMRAVEYGEKAIQLFAESPVLQPATVLEEANTRLLLSMALNYGQKGGIEAADIVAQFQKIDKAYLVKQGFNKNKILRALEDQRIIQLPNYFSEFNI